MKHPCSHFNDEHCGLELYGGRPSAGLCMQVCEQYQGPERTPELIAKFTQLTVNRQPAPAAKPTIKQIKQWLMAELSLLRQGPVPLAVFNQRLALCQSCPHRVVDDRADNGYCSKCGCGSAERARLDSKLHMPLAVCPIDAWKPARGEGRQQLARIGGVAEQVRGQVKQAAGGLVKLLLPE